MMLITVLREDGVQLATIVEAGKVEEVRDLLKQADPECSPRLTILLSVAQVIEKLKEVK